MPDLFKQLPALYWRGVGPLPVANRQVSFEQDIIRHKFMYRDDELVESVGRKNWIFSYTLAFYEDISPGKHGYKNLYTKTFPEFLAACRNREVGTLEDPLLGTFLARCETFNISTDINRRDGESVEVRFIYSPNEAEIDNPPPSLAALKQNGINLSNDARVALANIKGFVPQAVKTSLDAGKNSLGPLAYISNLANRSALYVDQFDATVGSYAAAVTNTVDAFERLAKRTPVRFRNGEFVGSLDFLTYMPSIREGYRQIDTLRRILDKNSAGTLKTSGDVATTKTTQDMPVGQVASMLGMNLGDFLALNSSVPKPLVPANTTVKFIVPKK